MVKINMKLLPIKAHFFFFMGAIGPILPQLSVYGKELGISALVMGTVTGILPVTFLFTKCIFGMIVDAFRTYRKLIFIALIAVMTVSFAGLYFVPAVFFSTYSVENATCENIPTCNVTEILESNECHSHIRKVFCSCYGPSTNLSLHGLIDLNKPSSVCLLNNSSLSCNSTYTLDCQELNEAADEEEKSSCRFDSTFWNFIVLMSVGTILFNVVNSISDAICFDVVGEEHDYGKQRVWGTIGWGVAAIISGYAVDWWSPGNVKSYTPMFVTMIAFTFFDIISCVKLKLPKIEPPQNILKDLQMLLSHRHTVVFLIFAIISGILDGFLIYFLLWYLEDLALEVQASNVKLLEGLVVAAETLGTEILFFSIAGKILDKIGYANCLSICFLNYAVRCFLVSIVPSPWWLIATEFVMQGPTYALTYSTIVGYANVIAPPGMSATTQGIAAGLDDGLGYAIGSILGGLLYKHFGGRRSFQIFAIGALLSAIAHYLLQIFYVKGQEHEVHYKTPSEAVTSTDLPH